MMFRSIWPFVLVAMCTLVLLILMPQLTLFLPNLLE
jgi:TRAP-type C4-dicarboxylate transport system permease large subunit